MKYPSQHDSHLIPWFKAKFNLTVQDNEHYTNKDWWRVYEGDYDLDIKEISHGPDVFEAAMEYCMCYNEVIGLQLEKAIGFDHD